jgi:predicted RecB family nuclease
MDAGAPLILGGWLPDDPVGHRTGRPDILVRAGEAPVAGRWRYLPVDVKHHGSIIKSRGLEVTVQQLADLSAPDDASAEEPVGRKDDKSRGDLLQLSHYWRMLEACGAAPPGPARGGILGRERAVVWYQLDVASWSGAPRRSSLELYDEEFAHRLAVAGAARAHAADPGVALLVEPARIGECDECGWRVHCRQLMLERHHGTLLPKITRDGAGAALAAAGVTDITALAGLPVDAPIPGLRVPLPGLVDEARAWLGPDPAYRRRDVDRIEVPRADIEVDVDMESTNGGAYLWGVLVTDRAGWGQVEEGYRPFVDWNPDTGRAAAAAFTGFWGWLADLRARCEAAGLSFAAYCWSRGAENRWLREGGRHLDVEADVEAFMASSTWIDLCDVFAHQIVTGDTADLKVVAQLTGFDWQDDDPGGGQSMVWRQAATDADLPAEEREEHRRRLLTYNEDDVRATLHVREWLDARKDDLAPAPAPS